MITKAAETRDQKRQLQINRENTDVYCTQTEQSKICAFSSIQVIVYFEGTHKTKCQGKKIQYTTEQSKPDRKTTHVVGQMT